MNCSSQVFMSGLLFDTGSPEEMFSADGCRIKMEANTSFNVWNFVQYVRAWMMAMSDGISNLFCLSLENMLFLRSFFLCFTLMAGIIHHILVFPRYWFYVRKRMCCHCICMYVGIGRELLKLEQDLFLLFLFNPFFTFNLVAHSSCCLPLSWV